MSRRPPLAFIFTVTLTGILNNALITPALPDILADLGVADERSGLLVASGSVAGIVVAPLVGFFADRYGRRVVLTSCLTAFGSFGLMAALSPSFEVLVLSRLLQGVGSAGLINLAVVLIGDHWSGSERTKIVGRNASILTVGLATIPLVSGTVTQLAGWRVTLGIYTVALATAVVSFIVLRDGRPTRRMSPLDQIRGAGEVIRQPSVAATFAVGFLIFVLIFGLFLTVLPLHLADMFGLDAGARGRDDLAPRRDLHAGGIQPRSHPSGAVGPHHRADRRRRVGMRLLPSRVVPDTRPGRDRSSVLRRL